METRDDLDTKESFLSEGTYNNDHNDHGGDDCGNHDGDGDGDDDTVNISGELSLGGFSMGSYGLGEWHCSMIFLFV